MCETFRATDNGGQHSGTYGAARATLHSRVHMLGEKTLNPLCSTAIGMRLRGYTKTKGCKSRYIQHTHLLLPLSLRALDLYLHFQSEAVRLVRNARRLSPRSLPPPIASSTLPFARTRHRRRRSVEVEHRFPDVYQTQLHQVTLVGELCQFTLDVICGRAFGRRRRVGTRVC